MIRLIWDLLYELWEQRNQDLHGHGMATQKASRHKLCVREIQLYYEIQHTFPTHLQHIFATPLSTLSAKKNYELCNWLELWRATLDQALQEKKDEEQACIRRQHVQQIQLYYDAQTTFPPNLQHIFATPFRNAE